MIKGKTQSKQTEIGLIPEDWEVLKARDYCSKVTDGTHDSPKQAKDGKFLITSRHIKSNNIDFENAYRISEVDFENINKRSQVNKNDILYSMIGTVGEICRVRNDKIDFAIKNIGLFKLKSEQNSEWLYYYLQSSQSKEYLLSRIAGSTQSYITLDRLREFPIAFPKNESEQQKIAEVLGALDEKIELNRKMNKTLESLGQAIFKRWFIENEDKKDWTICKLGSFFPIKTGKKDANFSSDNGKYPFFTCSQVNLKADDFSFDCSALLLAGNGDFSIKWYEGKFEAYQRTYVLEPYNKKLLGLLYFLVDYSLSDITAGHRGSVIHFLTKGMIEGYEIKIPSQIDLEEMAGIFMSIINNIDSNKKQIETLSQIRDSLLPRLMSGKLRVE